jgi:hypothetical protein
MTSTAATRISHDQQPGRSDMDEHQREEHLQTACRAAGQERRTAGEAAHRPSPEDPAAARQRARDATLAALTGAGLHGDEALAPTERAARQQDDESEVPACYAGHDVSRYPAQVGSISWHLLADGYTITWAPAPPGCSLTLSRHGPRGEHAAYRGTGPTMQRAWDEVRAQLGHGEPQPAPSGTCEAPASARGSDRLYRVVQYYDSWPFHNDSRVPRGSSVLSHAAAAGSARGQDAARRALARATPGDCRDITARLDAGDPVTGYLLGAPALSGTLDLARCFGIDLADGPVLAAVEDAFFTAGGEAPFTEAGRIARERTAQHAGTSSQHGQA